MNRVITVISILVFSIGILLPQSKAEGKMITFPTPDGRSANAFIISAKVPTTNYLFIFHEWWGLDDQVKKETIKYYNALEGVTVIALDLYDGVVAQDEEEAAELMRGAVDSRIRNIIKGAIAYAGNGAEIATLGWSFGATWALKASILMGEQADGCVMYYGMPEKDVDQLRKLETSVLMFFAKNDNWVTENTLEDFRMNMKEAGKTLDVITFEAAQAFANPNDKRYNRVAAGKSYAAALNYLRGRFEN